MLKEYFSLEISQNGLLLSLPLLLTNYLPDFTYLPSFLYHLGVKVTWEEETLCFNDIIHGLATFYSLHPQYFDETTSDVPSQISGCSTQIDYQNLIQYVIFPAFRSNFYPSTRHADDGTIIQIACLPDLYKVFERC